MPAIPFCMFFGIPFIMPPPPLAPTISVLSLLNSSAIPQTACSQLPQRLCLLVMLPCSNASSHTIIIMQAKMQTHAASTCLKLQYQICRHTTTTAVRHCADASQQAARKGRTEIPTTFILMLIAVHDLRCIMACTFCHQDWTRHASGIHSIPSSSR